MKAFKRTFLIVLALILIWGLTSIYFVYKATKDQKENIEFSDNINILVIGIDSVDPNLNENTRSDVMILLNINRSKNQISIISIPRDTKTAIKGRKYEEKINHAYAYGGPELSLQTVNNLFGTDIKHFVVLGYDFVKELIDLMGGVKVDVPMDMVYSDPTANPPLEINIKKGSQILDGEKGIGFLRYRKGYSSGDQGRIEAQQMFLSQFAKTFKSPLTIAKIPFIIKLYGNKTKSNLSMENIFDISISGAKCLNKSINMQTIPGSPKYINNISYYIHDENATRQLFYDVNN
ncbi:MAG: LCP family protein [Tissierellia bacterium]|nr:LCP family protein [Tissierellia bacterium]